MFIFQGKGCRLSVCVCVYVCLVGEVKNIFSKLREASRGNCNRSFQPVPNLSVVLVLCRETAESVTVQVMFTNCCPITVMRTKLKTCQCHSHMCHLQLHTKSLPLVFFNEASTLHFPASLFLRLYYYLINIENINILRFDLHRVLLYL